MDNEHQDVTKEEAKETLSNYVNIKKFHFVMLLFFTVLATAGISIFALSFGDEKAVTVGVQERTEFNKLYEAYDTIQEDYFLEYEEEDLINGAINGMVDALGDPYSDYMNQEETAQFNENITSSFQGIGAEIQSMNDLITVVSPIKGSPAERAGILPNDQILAVDGESIQGMSASEAVMLIRGEKGTDVTLTIQRPGADETIEVTITRDDIPLETVYYEMNDQNVATVQLTSFSETTFDELTEALQDLESQGMEALVLDLRQNPGGLLPQAISISNLFVPAGETIVQIEESNGEKQVITAQEGDKVEVPTAVVIDEGSASASEIVAAAVNETADIPLFGKNTFGKGTVQTAEDFSDSSNIKITTARWLTPNDNWVHEEGVAPTTEVDMPEYASLPYLNIDSNLEESMLSEDIRVAEQMLNALGLNPGNIDGLFDEETVSAVESYQEENELEVTGIIDPETASSIMLSLREQLEENDPQVNSAIDYLIEEAGIEAEEAS
ncbi:peptidase S41 [Jeotgalibacillus malaysiensis]|uniref:Peptidase S41 n=1 Tax=Jeotgalibacillus malaysiensis TaxID=1508404 RepID=A0A0B5AT70_9BACL|nr:S41 family peptidase [Jeotgalibacillus malaysiensis]AJD91224.1 peptidase S41 [Jeotgalibacillus malaysiensis]